MAKLGVVVLDGDAAPQNALINAIQKEAHDRVSNITGISFGMRGLLMEGFRDISDVIKDITSRHALDGDFQSILQTQRYTVSDDKVKEAAKKIKDTWDKIELDYLIVIAGVGGIITFREIANYLPEEYKMRYVVIPKSMNCDVGWVDNTLDSRIRIEQSPKILSVGYPTAAAVAKQETRWIMKGCHNGYRIMVTQHLGDYTGWNVAAAQEGGAVPVVLPEMFINNDINQMIELIVLRTRNKHKDYKAVVVAISESIPETQEELEALKSVYSGMKKRSIGNRPKNRGSVYRDTISEKLREGGYGEAGIGKMDITYQGRWRYPTELDIRLARLYGKMAVISLFDKNRKCPTMPYLPMDTLAKKDPEAMGADITIDDIKFAGIDGVVLQRVPDQYLHRIDKRPFLVGDKFVEILKRVTHSEKYDQADKLLMSAPPL